MRSVEISEAEANLEALVDRVVAQGEGFIITREGQPVAEVSPVMPAEAKPRRIGFMDGRFEVPADVKRIGRGEIDAAFEGR